MSSALYKYLTLYKKLDVPGIGCFTIEQKPAVLQFTDKKLLPPAANSQFAAVVHPTNNHFYSFLSHEWQVDKVIAIRRFKEEVEALLEELKKLGICELKGIGVIRKTADGSLGFAADTPSFSLFESLSAERVLRRNVHHTVLIGEQQHRKTHSQPEPEETVLYEPETVKDNWQLFALILAIVALLMIVAYYTVYK